MIRIVTTFFYIGLLRPASGTWGSLAALALGILVHEAGQGWMLPVLALLACGIGFWAVPRAIAGSADKDPSEIVIDEVAGQWIALSFTAIPLWQHGVSILTAWPGFVAPFLLFRLFDIWKPWIIGRADRRGDGIGVMLDDIYAGLFAGIASVILAGLYHAVLEPML